jgi:hypothetical protein
MPYPAHLAKLLAMQPPGAGPAPGQQYPGRVLKDTSITVSPRTLPFYPDDEPYLGLKRGGKVPSTRRTIAPDNGRQSRYGEPGAGPAPGQQMPGYAPMKKPSLRYAPGMYTEPERSPAPMRDVSESMNPQRAIPFERMNRR